MNAAEIATILDLAIKAVGVISTLIAAEQNPKPAIDILMRLLSGAKSGTITADQLDTEESSLDSMIADFNAPMA